ncbi:MAG: HAD hydrolase-like protein [Acidobacteriota bacterium]
MTTTNGDLRILLFDIDGTLLVPVRRGIYTAQVRRALIDIFGTAGIISEVSFGGKTDLQILREALTVEGITPEQIHAALPAIEDRFTAILKEMENDGPIFTCCPGVVALLESLSQESRYLLSILTGNVEPLAWAKLQSVGLAHYFQQRGAFGSDGEDRLILPAIAAQRITEALGGAALAPAQFVIIGDTPRDIACARHFGARVFAVASGAATVAELAAAQPDLLLEDLSCTNRVMAALREL